MESATIRKFVIVGLRARLDSNFPFFSAMSFHLENLSFDVFRLSKKNEFMGLNDGPMLRTIQSMIHSTIHIIPKFSFIPFLPRGSIRF